MRRQVTGAVLALLLAAGCGGGGGVPPTSPSPAPSPGPGGGGSSKLVVLDAGNFEPLVLAAPRPSLVKFQSPT